MNFPSALRDSYANRMQNQAASTGTDSSNADSTDGDKGSRHFGRQDIRCKRGRTQQRQIPITYIKMELTQGEADGYGGTIQVEMTL